MTETKAYRSEELVTLARKGTRWNPTSHDRSTNRGVRSAGNRNSMVEASRSEEERQKPRRSSSEGRCLDRDDEDSSSRKSRSEGDGLAGDDEDTSGRTSRSKSGGLGRKYEGSPSREPRSSNCLQVHNEDPSSRKPRSESCGLKESKSGSLERDLERIDLLHRSRSKGRNSRRDDKVLFHESRSKSSSLEMVNEDSSSRGWHRFVELRVSLEEQQPRKARQSLFETRGMLQ